ncbi:MAG: DNA repair exonuclease [Rhizobiales bacterium]|nr:DNA repair exonuclease [Hyphomicrobiales bacterium]
MAAPVRWRQVRDTKGGALRGLRFIHTADWQIGKPFARFGERARVLLDQARFDAIDRIAGLAAEREARHVLVAGDVFDSETLADAHLRRVLERLATAKGVIWHLIGGNHDPVRVGGVWSRVRRLAAPANVRLYEGHDPVEIEPGIYLLPATLKARATSIDPTAWMDDAPTPEGALRIDLAHGSVQSFGSDGESQVPIAADRAARAGLDYLALGDWHGMTRIGARCWYSGSPEPDRFRDNAPGHVLEVAIAGRGATPQVTAHRTGHFVWLERADELGGRAASDALSAIEEEVRRQGDDLRRLVLRLRLAGSVSLAERGEVEAWLARLEALTLHVEAKLDGLVGRPSEEELADLEAEGELARAVQHLRDQANGGVPAAGRALELLFSLAREVDRP